jgi:diguanylate cyclase (GGDEF)-like protein/PAS domain S-box-containing protein
MVSAMIDEIPGKYFRNQQQEPNRSSPLQATERQKEPNILLHLARSIEIIITSIQEGICFLDTQSNIVFVSPPAMHLTGFQEQDLIGACHTRLIPHLPLKHNPRRLSTCPLCVTVQQREIRQIAEGYFNHADGTLFPVTYTCIPIQEHEIFAGTLVIFRDITERKDAERQLRHQALHDALTNLPNRTLFLELLGHAMKYARRYQAHQFAVLVLDIDNFKVINDSLGPMQGDQLLITTAGRLKACLHNKGTVARFGSDEFAVLLEDVLELNDVLGIVEQIQAELAIPLQLHQHQLVVSACIGIALSSHDYVHPTDILRDADTAVYRAKLLGAGHHVVFDKMMRTSLWHRLDTESFLRKALEQQELLVYYQTIVSLTSQRIVGFEALVRWQHPQRGLVPPSDFISVAEETGLIVPIGWWILQESCQQLAQWKTRYPALDPLTVNINLSGQSFSSSVLIDKVRQVLSDTGIKGEDLKLEITESTMMDHADTTLITLSYLRNLGVQLCIDDFGTGYSSLRYLHRFPIQTLKIDQSFICGIDQPDNTESKTITQSIISLSHALGKEVVAEGIETQNQLDYLQKLECDYGQGYLFSKPQPATMLEGLLQQENCKRGGY